jgi:hypothetical protein
MKNVTKAEEKVAQELKRAEILSTSLRTLSTDVAPPLDRQNAKVVQEGETLPSAASDMDFKARILEEASNELTGYGTDLLDALAARSLFYSDQLVWFATTRGEMFAIQTAVRAQGGLDALKRLGLTGTLADTPEKLVLQGQRYRQRLTMSIVVRSRSGESAINPAVLAGRLDPPLSELELSHGLYLEADQNAANARKRKNEALDQLRLLNQTIGQETIAAYRRAGFKELANRLRRQLSSVLRPRTSGNTTTPPADQDDTSTTPAPDGQAPDTGTTPANTAPDTGTETPDDDSASSDATA